MRPLQGIKVVDFSQFLAGPACSLRLADLGAEVIKVERPGVGDICRQLYVAKQKVGDESTIFHAINRNKKSVAIDLKSKSGYQDALQLVAGADVVIQNFRPGVAKKLGIDWATLREVNPKLVYGSVSGYSPDSKTWKDKPGQDLLAQSLSGLVWSNGDGQAPQPMGLAIADLTAAYELAQGILSLLVRRGLTGEGGLTEVSLVESLISLQSVALFEHINHGVTSGEDSKDAQGIYQTLDGYLAIGSVDCRTVSNALALDAHKALSLGKYISQQPKRPLLEVLKSNSIPACPVLDWHELRESDHYKSLNFEQGVFNKQQQILHTTRCPVTIDGERFISPVGAPEIGEHTHLFIGNSTCS
ncbi:CaiB/BaiF CoA transferase family protein [Photobacterium sp. DNB23_23_1]